MSGPIYLNRGQGNLYTDQVYQSLMQYAMIHNRNKNIQEERQFQKDQIEEQRRFALDAADKQKTWELDKATLEGKIKKEAGPDNVDKAKQLVDSGATMRGGNVYSPKEQPGYESIPLVDKNGSVYGVMNKSPGGKITFGTAPQSPDEKSLEGMGYHKVGNKVIRFVEGQKEPELVFDGDTAPGKWTDAIVSNGGPNDPFPKNTLNNTLLPKIISNHKYTSIAITQIQEVIQKPIPVPLKDLLRIHIIFIL